MTSYTKGLLAEFYVRMFLRLRGFRVLKSRYISGRNTGRAEIDIIAKKKNLIIFIEVKNHKTYDSAWASISAPQAMRLRRAANTYLSQRHWLGDARFDVILVRGWKIFWIRGAI